MVPDPDEVPPELLVPVVDPDDGGVAPEVVPPPDGVPPVAVPVVAVPVDAVPPYAVPVVEPPAVEVRPLGATVVVDPPDAVPADSEVAPVDTAPSSSPVAVAGTDVGVAAGVLVVVAKDLPGRQKMRVGGWPVGALARDLAQLVLDAGAGIAALRLGNSSQLLKRLAAMLGSLIEAAPVSHMLGVAQLEIAESSGIRTGAGDLERVGDVALA